MGVAPSRQELEAEDCWESGDHVPRDPVTTAFRRRVRLQQARWREANGLPIGSQPMVPKAGVPVRRVGSRLPLDLARESGANFVTPGAFAAAQARMSYIERQQSLDGQGLWADLLSKVALSFNLFGDLADDLGAADRAVRTWWPDTPGPVSGVRFAHSPGRLDPAYIGNLCAFDAAFTLDLGEERTGMVAVRTAFHDVNRRQAPKPARLARYVEVTERSGIFRPGWLDPVNGTELIHIWLEHALLLSMLQHPDDPCSWGRYVVVHPAGNANFASACARYRDLLADPSTFTALTIEELLAGDGLPDATVAAFTSRYLPMGGD